MDENQAVTALAALAHPQRLRIFRQSDDGFAIAEADLRLRGPGEVLGTRQSGLPDYKLADLAQDQDLLGPARDVAATLVKEDPALARDEAMAP